eukprot:CAMPEP_0179877404 /NCGR_PEP_ID=MMETSP0982-20121206/24775_1 /TAXON_ID=483367 /ORGANISM="non described non described, Strain CCMP 2436" /LENGTH=177 /DNA_ID=CAMNT_0021770007 /DNA_START=200 /DNA_END=730 /DNA_ORIENTATION=+
MNVTQFAQHASARMELALQEHPPTPTPGHSGVWPLHAPRLDRDARGAEAALPTHRLVERVHLHHLGRRDLLEHELGDAVAAIDLEVALAVIEENDAHVAPVVLVDHPRTHVDEMLPREAGARSDAAVVARGDRYLQVRLAERLAARGHHAVVCRRKVVARGARRAARRQRGEGRQLL